MSRFAGSLKFWFFLLVTVVAFQNCGQPKEFSNSAKIMASASSGGGTGNGYDGKVFAEFLRTGLCADKSSINAKIAVYGARSLLIRDNCTDLPSTQWREVIVQGAGSGSLTVTEGGVQRTFVAINETPPPLPTPTPTPAPEKKDVLLEPTPTPGPSPTPAAISPANLRLSHTSNSKFITVSWDEGTGGDSSCLIQYSSDRESWTSWAGAQRCDMAVAGRVIELPGDGWTSNFSHSGVAFRLAAADGVPYAEFPTRATCVPQQGSGVATPTIDENCDGRWDDRSFGERCMIQNNGGSYPFSSAQNCSATIQYNGRTCRFVNGSYQGGVGVTQYSDAMCTIQEMVINNTDFIEDNSTFSTPSHTVGSGIIAIVQTMTKVNMLQKNSCVQAATGGSIWYKPLPEVQGYNVQVCNYAYDAYY